jgi:hypothetical protein
VLRSIGYSGVPIDGAMPFDPKRGIIPNANGRVNGCKGTFLFCTLFTLNFEKKKSQNYFIR